MSDDTNIIRIHTGKDLWSKPEPGDLLIWQAEHRDDECCLFLGRSDPVDFHDGTAVYITLLLEAGAIFDYHLTLDSVYDENVVGIYLVPQVNGRD